MENEQEFEYAPDPDFINEEDDIEYIYKNEKPKKKKKRYKKRVIDGKLQK